MKLKMICLGMIFLALSVDSFAWGKFGHVTICEIAYRELGEPARTELNRLLVAHGEYTSFNQACLEADRFPRTRPADHFVNYSRDELEIVDDTCGDATSCVISAINSDLAVLSDPSRSDTERGEALVLLGHWVGDIHQPLHVSFKDDRGGNSIKKRGRCSASNLHAVWDNCIVERRILPGNALVRLFGWAKFTRAYRAADELSVSITPDQKEAWLESDVVDWAAESYEITLDPSVDYCHLRNNACWYDTQNKFLDADEEERTVQMTDDYLDTHTSTVKTRLSQAGVRLGALLNQALGPSN